MESSRGLSEAARRRAACCLGTTVPPKARAQNATGRAVTCRRQLGRFLLVVWPASPADNAARAGVPKSARLPLSHPCVPPARRAARGPERRRRGPPVDRPARRCDRNSGARARAGRADSGRGRRLTGGDRPRQRRVRAAARAVGGAGAQQPADRQVGRLRRLRLLRPAGQRRRLRPGLRARLLSRSTRASSAGCSWATSWRPRSTRAARWPISGPRPASTASTASTRAARPASSSTR